ncbi:MAG: hypothetical protein RMJ55_07995 [Roseiflexaceae bacterium]|nr:hypothetical protein [Roseiflexaceae bacterium]
MVNSDLKLKYEAVKQACNANAKSDQAGQAILDLAVTSLDFLKNCIEVSLTSEVLGKSYIAFQSGNIVSRPANQEFFLMDSKDVQSLWGNWIKGKADKENFEKLIYTVALAPCLAIELFDRQNKKGPATFFECYVSHLFSRAVNVNPTKRAKLDLGNTKVSMTMDFLFETNDWRVHLPVKMSSRERVVQAWAHQRLLDVVYADRPYRGIMVLFSETKLDSRSHEVVEICVPDQWLAYQKLLSRMHRIYYFDVPDRYLQLARQFPEDIVIKRFGVFFTEKEEVLRS